MEYDLNAQRLRPTRAPAAMRAPRCLLGPSFHCFNPGEPVPKPNYHQAKKQRELARKTRQQAKQERRAARPGAPGENAAETPAPTPTAPDPVSGDGA